MLKTLEESVSRFRDVPDLAALALVQAKAQALAETSEGRARKKAERIAQKASLITADLRRHGAETNEEREAREVREARNAAWEEKANSTKLMERLVTLLHLLLGGSSPVEGVAALRGLAMADPDGYLRIEIPELGASSSSLLFGGYEGSRQIFSEVATKSLEKERQTFERALKVVAVDLMTAGAEVRGLEIDAVPLVAYALSRGQLPGPFEALFSSAAERVDNLLLRISDDVSAMPIDARPLFIGLFRLALLLGEAEVYADRLSLTSLSFTR
jgi:hypothetical protein